MTYNLKGKTKDTVGSVYLIHFSAKLAHAQHYVGFAEDVGARLKKHNNGTGARLTNVVREKGIELVLARVWEGKDRAFERSLKNQKNSRRYCPICRAATQEEEK